MLLSIKSLIHPSPSSLKMTLILIFILSFLILSLTCFSKVLIALQALKQALGLNEILPQSLIWVFTILLSLLMMMPVFQKISMDQKDQALITSTLLNQKIDPHELPQYQVIQSKIQPVFLHFMAQNTNQEIKEKIKQSSITKHLNQPESQLQSLLLDIFIFLISEIQNGFLLALWILLPFLLIDIMIAQIISIFAIQINQTILAIPIKIALFLAIDGWVLISEKLILSYQV
jgi:flagellar biosynthetic protein FliP